MMKNGSKLRFSLVLVAVFVVFTLYVDAEETNGLLEYRVKSIDPQSWVVTAEEVATGNVVKFRLPPAVFKGQTFDLDMEKLQRGKRFSVRGPRNARLRNLTVVDPMPKRAMHKRPMRRHMRPMEFKPEMLGWVIMDVNGQDWVVTAQNSKNQRKIKFKVNPNAFAGFKFMANLEGIGKGEGFQIITPNEELLKESCTLLE